MDYTEGQITAHYPLLRALRPSNINREKAKF